jgi:hypothetical protein
MRSVDIELQMCFSLLTLDFLALADDSVQEPEGVLKGDANPGPTAEIEFWENKSGNLNLVHEQLNGEKVRRVMKVLEVTKSTYFPAFNRLCKEVAQARMEVFARCFSFFGLLSRSCAPDAGSCCLSSRMITCCISRQSNL